ncbi:structural protein [Leptolyngbya phage Lbo-JY16]
MAFTRPGVNSSSQDLVAILDAETFQPLFSGTNIMRVTVRDTSKLISFPVEDGTQRTDHRVLDPIEIDLPILLTDDVRNLFEQLRQAYIEGRDLIVQTKVRSYPSVMIYEFPHEEIPEQGDSIPVAIRMREIKVIKPEFGTLPPAQVANRAQSSTVQKGAQQTEETDAPTRRKASVLYGVFN